MAEERVDTCGNDADSVPARREKTAKIVSWPQRPKIERDVAVPDV